MLLFARALTGSLHGLFIGAAFAAATSLVPPERMGRAISIVIAGIAVSTALGVPVGTLIGQQFGWRAGFVGVVALGGISLIAIMALVPAIRSVGAGGFATQARHALAPRVLALLGVGFLLIGGRYAALTYITPFLQQVTGISGGWIGIFLFAYGAATAIGTFAGGWAADRNPGAALIGANIVLILALGLLYLAGSVPLLVALTMGVWGVVGFGLVPSLQYRVVSLAGPGRDFAATLPASAVTAGIAVGALVGGWAVAGHGASAAIVTGLATCVIALPATWASGWLKMPVARDLGKEIEVRDGAKQGDLVVLNPPIELVEGSKVEVAPAAAAGPT